MPFGYLDGHRVNPWSDKELAQKALETRLDEVRYRARLLRALGYAEKAAVERIQQNLSWEYEMTTKANFLKQAKEVVAEVYKRRQSFGTIA